LLFTDECPIKKAICKNLVPLLIYKLLPNIANVTEDYKTVSVIREEDPKL
jgi:hypothetical protein